MRYAVQPHVCLLLLGILPGCGKPAPKLQYLDIGSDESLQPMVFGVSVENVGNAAATVDGCRVEILATHMFPVRGSEEKLPPKFEHSWRLWETQDGLSIKPGESRLIAISLTWELDDAAAEFVAICQAKFYVEYDGGPDVTSDAVMFVLTSTETALEKLLGESMGDVSNSAEILRDLREFRGEKSPNARRVIDKLAEAIGS